MTDQECFVTGGVDTHKDIHVAAVVDQTGRILGTAPFPATCQGYRLLECWISSFGRVDRVGVEGTGAYGCGLARHLNAAGVEVVEVNRPNRQARRRRGKNDTVDAESAARAALNGEATVVPKTSDGIVESIRALRVAFKSLRASRARVALQIRDLTLTAPDRLRSELGPLNTANRVDRAARFRPGDITVPLEATKKSMKVLAQTYQRLTADMDQLRADLDRLTEQANPALRQAVGVGIDVAAILLIAAGDNPERLTSDSAFAAMCGACPIEASSGRTVRYRLNRGGNRQANHALWRIALVRLSHDPETQAYAARRRAEGKTTRDIIRCLKRYIAREVFRLLTNPPEPAVHPGPALREARCHAGLTQLDVATALGTHGPRISNIENQHRTDRALIE